MGKKEEPEKGIPHTWSIGNKVSTGVSTCLPPEAQTRSAGEGTRQARYQASPVVQVDRLGNEEPPVKRLGNKPPPSPMSGLRVLWCLSVRLVCNE